MTRSNAESAYMQWAKLHSVAEFNLATSGMAAYPLAELEVKIEQLEINGPVIYGYEPLRAAIAARYRVDKENVVTAEGTSMANHLAMAAVTEPGDEILVEEPTYELLLSAAKYLGLRIKRFARARENAFQPDLTDLQQKLSRNMRLVVLTNLHNPSGVLIPQATMKKIGELARNAGAQVLVDEVYLETLYQKDPGSAFHLDPKRFLITNSLTKGYGLSGLRCGWILASADVAQRIWSINDLYSATPAFPAAQLSVIAFAKLDKVMAAASASLEQSRKLLREFLESRKNKDLDHVWPEYGTVAFPRLLAGNVDDFCKLLRDQFKTTVVPGKFFEMPEHFRVGVGGGPAQVEAALQQLARGLDAYARSQKSAARH